MGHLYMALWHAHRNSATTNEASMNNIDANEVYEMAAHMVDACVPLNINERGEKTRNS